ncbi:MAG: FHA domain-containing protein [Lentisphaeria bacterium]|nr:FHA domain-containing protein [Lentisphaeria bacterium]
MRVIFTRGLLAGNVVDFRETLIRIGRSEENELCLMTDGVSRRHGQLRRDDTGRWLVSDLGSTNGIKVNGVRISGEIEVREGDDIEIGEQCMRIDLSDE